jgi:hypothetical protein
MDDMVKNGRYVNQVNDLSIEAADCCQEVPIYF